jgi:hypothetical protein
MVPTGQDRQMSVVTDAEPCIISVDPTNVARLHNYHFDHGVPDTAGDFGAVVTANNRVTFDIFGQRKGNTNVKLSTQNGAQIDTLTVSVKEKITKTYNTCRLSDMRRVCPFSTTVITSIMPRVEKTYIQQANIELKQQQAGRVFEVNVPRDLGDPLFPEKSGIRQSIIDAMAGQLIFLADFIVFFAWDLRALTPPKEIVGLNLGIMCFVEFDSRSISERDHDCSRAWARLGIRPYWREVSDGWGRRCQLFEVAAV